MMHQGCSKHDWHITIMNAAIHPPSLHASAQGCTRFHVGCAVQRTPPPFCTVGGDQQHMARQASNKWAGINCAQVENPRPQGPARGLQVAVNSTSHLKNPFRRRNPKPIYKAAAQHQLCYTQPDSSGAHAASQPSISAYAAKHKVCNARAQLTTITAAHKKTKPSPVATCTTCSQ
jgi:hypothetical protein